jgi:hypothetical protein
MVVFTGQIRAQVPDLIVNRSRLVASIELQTRNFPASDCAVVEGCVSAGTRKLLLFEVAFANVGRGDLVIGNPADNPDLFHYSPCHGHSHMEGTADYELLSNSGQSVARARKQAFCFRDNEPFLSTAGPTRGYDCDNQGITAGWQDIYYKGLDCQWLDVTGLAPGTYTLRITCNPERVFVESNYGNNSASATVVIPGAPATSTTVTPAPKPSQPVKYTPPAKHVKHVKKSKKVKRGKHKGWYKKPATKPVASKRSGDDDDDD